MKIITLTLSPAFDTHCHADSLRLQHENLIHMDLCQAGGKGVNISRALVSCGTENLALAVLGEENADTFCRNLTADGVTYEAITVPGRIRENITIHVADGTETRLSYPGFPVTEDLLTQVEEKLMALVGAPATIAKGNKPGNEWAVIKSGVTDVPAATGAGATVVELDKDGKVISIGYCASVTAGA